MEPQQPSIEALQQELEALKPNQLNQPKVETAPDITGIADDDPELSKLLVEPGSELAFLFPKLVSTNLEGAKILLANSRKQQALTKTVQDEALPMEQRIAAAHQWRGGLICGKDYWSSLGDVELIERLSVHPHTTRLLELYAYVDDSVAVPATGDWQQYLRDQWAAIKEFKKLKSEYPLRKIAGRYEGIANGTVILGLQGVACKVMNNSPKELLSNHSIMAKVFGYVKELEAGQHFVDKPEAAPEPEPKSDSALPWYLQESYLKEKQQKEQPSS